MFRLLILEFVNLVFYPLGPFGGFLAIVECLPRDRLPEMNPEGLMFAPEHLVR